MLANRKQAKQGTAILGVSGGAALVNPRPGHLPVMAPNLETLLPEPGEFRLSSPVLMRDNQVLVNMAGSMASSTEIDPATALYSPGLGRFVFSTVPFQGAVEGKLQLSQITFTLEDKSYLLLTGAPISRSEHVWVLHQPDWRPAVAELEASLDQPGLEASSLRILLGKK